jgi:hypothetical protein
MTKKRIRRAAALGTTALVTAGLAAPPARATPVAASLGLSHDELRAAVVEEPPKLTPLDEALAVELGVNVEDVREIVDADRTKPGSKPDRTTLLPALVSGLHLDESTVAAAFDRVEADKAADHRARIAGLVVRLAATSPGRRPA